MARGDAITIGTAAAALGGAYKLGEFLMKAKKLKDVGPSNAVYVRLIGRVRSDLDEVRRLLSVRAVHDELEANPEKSKWVYGCMRDVRGALENISPHTERVASDIDDGRHVGIRHRVYWLTSEKEKLENRERELFYAHSSLGEVIGYLTALEPVKEKHKPEKTEQKEKNEKKETHIDIDIHRGDIPPPQSQHPHTITERVVDREVWVERDGAPPRRVEERDVYIDRGRPAPARFEEREIHIDERGPRHLDERVPRYQEERDIHVDTRGPRHLDERVPRYQEERDIHVDARGPRYHEERDIHIQRGPDPNYEERDIHIHRDVDPRYEAQHHDERYEHHDQHQHGHQQQRAPYPEERYPPPPPQHQHQLQDGPLFHEPASRQTETFEDRLPERDSWMQSSARRGQQGYAEYGAPQPIGAANYTLPPNQDYAQREMWIEEKEDYRFDQYGNRLPDRFFQSAVPRPGRNHL